MALAYLVSFIPWLHWERDKISVIARQISLGMVGLIILSSIRLVLRGVNRVRPQISPGIFITYLNFLADTTSD